MYTMDKAVIEVRKLPHPSAPFHKGGESDMSYVWVQKGGTSWAHTS